MKKVKTFDIGKSHFQQDGTQNYLVFQRMYRYFKIIVALVSGNYIYYRKSKALSHEKINSIKTPDFGITPKLNYYGIKTRVELNESCLKQDKFKYVYGKIVNIYIAYESTGSNSGGNNPTVKSSLLGAVTLTQNADNDKYKYSGYGNGFDRRSSFSF